MRITIIAFGTRGDVQPAIALAKAMQTRAGHQVRILASAHFQDWIEGHGLEAAPSNVDIQALMDSESGHAWAEHGSNALVEMRIMRNILQSGIGWDMIQQAWSACQDAQAIFSSFTSDVYAVSLAEKLGVPHVSMPLQPALVATRSGAATFGAPLPRRNSRLNYWFSKLLVEATTWRIYGQIPNQFRTQVLGLPAQTQAQNFAAMRRMLVLLAYSAHVVPHPQDWPPNMHTTGYWFLDENPDWQAPSSLLQFLEEGERPLCIGFGSMTGRDPAALTREVVTALAQTRQRAVILSGWAGLGEACQDCDFDPSRIYNIDMVPHQWLFPRVSAVIHHGGAGTTAACLRAGVPSIIVPHLGDQAFWGKRVEILGAGPPAIPRERLSAQSLSAAINRVLRTPSMRQRAGELASLISSEDGIGTALRLFEEYVTDPKALQPTGRPESPR